MTRITQSYFENPFLGCSSAPRGIVSGGVTEIGGLTGAMHCNEIEYAIANRHNLYRTVIKIIK